MSRPGRIYLDGSVLIGAMDGVVRDRIRMALNGHVVVTVIIDEADEPLGDAWCETMGLPETGRSNAPLVEVLEADLTQFLSRAEGKTLTDDDKLEDGLRRIARQIRGGRDRQEAGSDGGHLAAVGLRRNRGRRSRQPGSVGGQGLPPAAPRASRRRR